MRNPLGSSSRWSSSSVSASEGDGESPATPPGGFPARPPPGWARRKPQEGLLQMSGGRRGANPVEPRDAPSRGPRDSPLSPGPPGVCRMWFGAEQQPHRAAPLSSPPPARLTPFSSLPRHLGLEGLRGGLSSGLPRGLDPVPHQTLQGLTPAVPSSPCTSPHHRATSAWSRGDPRTHRG